MEANVSQFTCQSCGGILKWNIQKQSFECESCRTPGRIILSDEKIYHHPLKEYKERETSGVSFPEKSFSVCASCGAEVIFEENQTATVCPMCGSSQVNNEKQIAGVPPDGVIPFKIDKADAQENFKKWVKSRWFAPNRLKESYQQGKLAGIYLPFWTFDADADAHYQGQGGIFVVEDEDDEGHSRTRTDWYPVSGYVQNNYDDIQICSGGQQAQEVIDGVLPYSTEAKALPYSGAYLSGFGAEHYHFDANEGFEHAKREIDQDLTSLAEGNIILQGYDTANVQSLDVNYKNVAYKHLLLPAWLSGFAYKGKQYTYIINGENGNVGGQRPYSAPKIITAILAALLILFGIYMVFSDSAEAKEIVFPTETTLSVEIDPSTVSTLNFHNSQDFLYTFESQRTNENLAA